MASALSECQRENAATSERQDQQLPELHKDFYLNHPSFRYDEEACYGNLEAAHPILSCRSSADVRDYRRQKGILVKTVRGREPPKPFQSFSETSFPDFVEELAYELFTTEAKPFAVQAQAWPCALSGMDLVVVAPTGSGKTLSFLLPALVHLMAQPALERNEGPIALVLTHSRELAQQTCSVAKRFFERTKGDDALRASAVFGGVHPGKQLPSKDAPDHGRWPELLVATPKRLLDLWRRQWLTFKRVSYVVLDEADLLLVPRKGWLPEIRAILDRVRPDRQLLLFSATWPVVTEDIASKLCGAEFVKLSIEPPVPPVSQEVWLFKGSDDPPLEAFPAARWAALVKWFREEAKADESVLIFCHPRTIQKLVARPELAEFGKSATFLNMRSKAEDDSEEHLSAYQRFVRGEVRILFTSIDMGSRGLDYADTAAAAADAIHLSLAVVIFDFPLTVTEYAHCIGRTSRPGHRAGRALAFFPERRFWMARELSALLTRCEQTPSEELNLLIAQDSQFLDECRHAMEKLVAGEHFELSSDLSGDFDADKDLWTLPASLPSYRRRLLHGLSDEFGLCHISTGDQAAADGRRIHVARTREALPGPYFIEGEEVEIDAMKAGDPPLQAIVVDPRIPAKKRTVLVQYEGGEERDVCVDYVRPRVTSGIA